MPDSANSVLERLVDPKSGLTETMSLLSTAVRPLLFLVAVFVFSFIVIYILCCESAVYFDPKTQFSCESGLLVWVICTLLWGVLVLAAFYYGFELLLSSIQGTREDSICAVFECVFGRHRRELLATLPNASPHRVGYDLARTSELIHLVILRVCLCETSRETLLFFLANSTQRACFVDRDCIAAWLRIAHMVFSRRCFSFYLYRFLFDCRLFAVTLASPIVANDLVAFQSIARRAEVRLRYSWETGRAGAEDSDTR